MASIKSIFEIPTRPCWVDGRRAIFHRWTDSARPVKARGVEESEETPRYQLHSVHALVEYEDGTMERVWPNAVRFADSAVAFAEHDWTTMEDWRDAKDNMPPLTPNDCIKITSPNGGKTCLTCGYTTEACLHNCETCPADGCRCRHCDGASLWVPKVGSAL